ncbi:MAG TPA: C39 family peptidase [Thermodesulfobacteriota bacterium]|nr:C39 family peptidase [Thermodesulfobacteriota bacterium]
MSKKLITRCLVLSLLLIASTGCSLRTGGAVLEEIRANPGAGHFIEGVPFFPQDEQMCGPAALASVMGYYGAGSGMEAVAARVYEERLKGTLPVDLLIYAKEKGFRAQYYRGSLEDLKERLSEDKPLILFLNLGIPEYPVGHYIVAVGYNDRVKAVVAHSGVHREKVYSYRGLLKHWGKTGFSTLLITPEEDL